MKCCSIIARRFNPAHFVLLRVFSAGLALMGLFCLYSLQCAANSLSEYVVYLTARPDIITAETGSSTTITIEVRDSDGRTPPNGTIVELSASIGRIEPRATLTNGVARARMESTLTSGVSLITAAVKGSRGVAETRVEILPPGTKLEIISGITISTEEGQLLYDSERYIVDGAGGVQVTMGSLKISSQYAVADLSKRMLWLRGTVTENPIQITRDNITITADEALLDLNKMTGLLFSSGDDAPRRQLISLRDLKPREETDMKSFTGQSPQAQGVFLISAKRIIAKPGKEIKLVRPSFYLEGDKTVTMPYYKIPLGPSRGRNFTLGSEGLRVDVPIYLSLTESSSTAIRFRRQEVQGWGYYGGSKRWETDLVRDYDTDSGASGQISLRRIGTGDWGLRWVGRNDLGNGVESYIFFDSPSHKDFYTNIDLTKSARKYTSSFAFRANRLSAGRNSYYTGLSYQVRPFELGSRTLTMALSGRSFYDSSIASVGNHLGASGNVQLYAGPYNLVGSTELSAQVSAGNVWGGSNPGKSVYGNAGVYTDFGSRANLGINYSYSWEDAKNGGTFDYLSADLYLSPFRRVSTHLSVIRGLRESSTSSFGNLSYKIGENWDLRLLSTWQKYSDYSFSDAQIGVIRNFKNQEARLFYSKSRKRVLFEFAAAGL